MGATWSPQSSQLQLWLLQSGSYLQHKIAKVGRSEIKNVFNFLVYVRQQGQAPNEL